MIHKLWRSSKDMAFDIFWKPPPWLGSWSHLYVDPRSCIMPTNSLSEVSSFNPSDLCTWYPYMEKVGIKEPGNQNTEYRVVTLFEAKNVTSDYTNSEKNAENWLPWSQITFSNYADIHLHLQSFMMWSDHSGHFCQLFTHLHNLSMIWNKIQIYLSNKKH